MNDKAKTFFRHPVVYNFMYIANQVSAAEIWVALNGSDKNAGTKEAPVASVAMALRKARELRRLNDPSIKNGIRIRIKRGLYQFVEPLFIRPEDSGTAISPTTIENADEELPVLSGGINIKGWRKVTGIVPGLPKEAQGKVWVAEAPMVGGNILNSAAMDK